MAAVVPTVPSTLAAPLRAILEIELATGNAVAEVSNWLPRCELLVVLRQPFGRLYPLPARLTYHPLNDPHYWLADYSYDNGRQVLACRFS